MIRLVLEFLVEISNSKLDVVFITDSVSTAIVGLSSYTTYKEDTSTKKKPVLLFTFRNRNFTVLRTSQSAGHGGFYHCANFCKPINYSLWLPLTSSLFSVDTFSVFMFPLHCTQVLSVLPVVFEALGIKSASIFNLSSFLSILDIFIKAMGWVFLLIY